MNSEDFAKSLETICGLLRLTDGDKQVSQYGTPYITFAIGGFLKEGDTCGLAATSERIAWAEFAKSFITYASRQNKPGISWRVKPGLSNIEWKDDSELCITRHFNVRARFSLESI